MAASATIFSREKRAGFKAGFYLNLSEILRGLEKG